jgi:vancomycin resistance protein YoaR
MLRFNNERVSAGTTGQRREENHKFFDTTAKKGARRGLTGPLLVACALLAVLVAADYWSNMNKIYRGVSVGSVAVGGKAPGEARKLLEDRAASALTEIRLTGPEEFVLRGEEVNVDFDVAGTVDRAYAVGRQGGLLERLGDRVKAALGAARVAPAVEYRPEAARAAVEDFAARVNREPRSAAVIVRGAEAAVVESKEGYDLNVPATVENVDQAIEDLNGEARVVGEVLEPKIATPAGEDAASKARQAMSDTVVLTTEGRRWELSPAEIGESLDFVPEGEELRVAVAREDLKAQIEDVYANLTVEPVEAGYEVNGSSVSVTPSREGQKIASEKLLSAIEEGVFEGEREYQVPIVVDRPNLTTAEAEELKPTQLLGSYRTNYSIVPDTGARVENLDISSNAVSGTFLAPGEVFSMNEKLAPLDYNETKVIINGRETKADGGGLCQVTSTLYNAVNEAGLDVTERTPHYAQLPYIRPGLDATVWFGALDMKFENTTDAYVLLREWVSEDGYVYAEVWGQPNGTEVKTWSEPVHVGEDYSKWVTYQTFKRDGKVLYDGVLHKDTYQPLIDEKGRKIPPSDVPVAPVNP